MNNVDKHTIRNDETIRSALIRLDKLAVDAILFVVDELGTLLGSLTDGDLRRGFIKGLGFDDSIMLFVQPNPAYITENDYSQNLIDEYKKKNFKIIPIIDEKKKIVDILNFRINRTLLPANAVIMAGGKGQRLLPLTENTPKPLLKIGEKPIIEYNIDRLIQHGIKHITLSVNYLANQLIDYFKDGKDKDILIDYIKEEKPLGTIGSVLLKEDFEHDDIFIMNSDLLTNIDFIDFYKTYINSRADMAVAAISYKVNVPYGVLETSKDNQVVSLKEKPSYTYFSNAGIYILKKRILEMIPKDSFFDITDLMQKVMEMNYKLVTYPINGYWLDIGKHEDYKKAQEDIKHLKF